MWRNVTDRYLALKRIGESERKYRLVAENASDVVFQIDFRGGITWVSPSVHEVLGWGPMDLIGSPLKDLVHPDDGDAIRDVLSLASRSAEEQTAVARWKAKNGSYAWMLLHTHEIPADEEGPRQSVMTLQDFEAVTQARHELAIAEALFEALSRSPSVGMVRVSADGRFQSTNEAMGHMLGRSQEWVLAHALGDLVEGAESGASLVDLHGRVRLDGDDGTGVARLRHADGRIVWARWWGTWVPDGADAQTALLLQVQDVSAEHAAVEELAFRATHDPLTGLANRSRILELLEAELVRARLTQSRVAVLFLDLDHFRVVNDSLGHAVGDDVLAEAATRMASSLRHGDHIGRLGGDEFLIVVPDAREEHEVEQLAHRIDQALRVGVRIDVHVWPPRASIGIALSTATSTAGALLREADSALFRAKATGRGRWQFFDEEMHTEALERLTLQDEIRASLANEDFIAYYQPIVSLADASVTGHESVVRWRHPTRGLLEPGAFLHVAEDAGLIGEIDAQVLRQVCQVLGERDDLPGTISVNKSPSEFAQPGWLDEHLGVLESFEVEPRRVTVELTETAVLSSPAALRRDLLELRRLGVHVHVDDFGTGYSSIALLRDLPVTGLKLDLSFTRLILKDSTARQLAAGLAALARGLDLVSIAEGVEEQAQVELLRSQGWSLGQGWLFGEAAPEPVTRVA